MGRPEHHLTLLSRRNPKAAKAEILAAVATAQGSVGGTHRVLGVSSTTCSKLVRVLHIERAFAQARDDAKELLRGAPPGASRIRCKGFDLTVLHADRDAGPYPLPMSSEAGEKALFYRVGTAGYYLRSQAVSTLEGALRVAYVCSTVTELHELLEPARAGGSPLAYPIVRP